MKWLFRKENYRVAKYLYLLWNIRVESKEYKNCILFSHLANLGNYFPLDIFIEPFQVQEQLQGFEDSWVEYNPKKKGFRRYGLSVTSLDGGLSGVPDLTSVYEYNLANNTNHDELSFRVRTAVYNSVAALRPLFDEFNESIGRTHFLKFDEGGFFPFHRDSQFFGEDTFRLFVPLHMHGQREFVFLLGDEILKLESGRVYFINTKIEHAVFSFCENSVHLVMNVELSESTVKKVVDLLIAK